MADPTEGAVPGETEVCLTFTESGWYPAWTVGGPETVGADIANRLNRPRSTAAQAATPGMELHVEIVDAPCDCPGGVCGWRHLAVGRQCAVPIGTPPENVFTDNIAGARMGSAPGPAAAPAEARSAPTVPPTTESATLMGDEAQAATPADVKGQDRFYNLRADGRSAPGKCLAMVRGCSRCRRVIYAPRSFCSGCGDRVSNFLPKPGERVA